MAEKEEVRDCTFSFLRFFMALLAKFFFYGVITLIPVLIALWLFSLFWGGQVISLRWILEFVLERFIPAAKISEWMVGIALLLIIMGIGALSSVISKGKGVYSWITDLVQRILGGRIIKQYQGVVVFEYFREGIWVPGIVTGHIKGSEHLKRGKILKIFVPGVPIPVTGLSPIFIQERDVIHIDLPVNEVVNIYTSGGILAPKKIPELVKELEKREVISEKDK